MAATQDDLEQIRQLKARYFRLMDTKQWDAMNSLFTEDVVATYEGPPRLTKDDDPKVFSCSGRATLVGGIKGLLEQGQSIHQGFMPELELTSDTTATGVWAMFDYIRLPNGSFKGWGHYHEHYVKEADGWKIKSIHLTRLHVEEVWQGI